MKMKEKRELFCIDQIINLGDLGAYLKDSSLDSTGCMFYVKGARIGSDGFIYEDMDGYQALGTEDETQITNPAFRLNLGNQYSLLGDYDVINDTTKSVMSLEVAFEYANMKSQGLAPNEINQMLMNKYNGRESMEKASQKII